MAQQTIGLGLAANDDNGDDLRAAGAKINSNFDELYARVTALESGAIGIDVLLGKTTVGDQSPTNFSSGNILASGPYTALSGGALQSIHFYSNTVGVVTLGVYEDNAGAPGALLAVTTEVATVAGGWVSAPASGTIVEGDEYWIAVVTGNTQSLNFDNAASGVSRTKASAYSAGSLPDPFPGSPTLLARRYPMYLTYETT